MARSLIVALLLGLIPVSASAHGGGLDASGCHTNRKTGDYHCHGSAPPPAPAPATPRPAAPPSPSSRIAPLYSSPPAPAPSIAVRGVATERQLILTAQLLLSALGYRPGQPDGLKTPTTVTAIKQFQADHSFDQDGLVSGTLLVRLAEQIALRAR